METKNIQNDSFYIIGIGTSAGGLEALKLFFDNLPSNFNHAIVIVQHLSPDYKSLMAELLSKNTDLPIHEATENILIQPGNVYLIPTKKNMTVVDGKLHLTDKPKKGFDLNLPIDIFFKSLALSNREKAIGIVLSGTGSDGSRGMRVIKEYGGMLMVQSPSDAKFDGMPNSAIATGLVDYILPVVDIPTEMINFINHPNIQSSDFDDNSFVDNQDFRKLIALVLRKTKVDFSSYKTPTLARRVVRRMSVNKCDSIRDYLNFIIEHEVEAELLYREFLIGVTKFFRDIEAFNYLEKEIIPELFRGKMPRDTVKLWSVACSSGEEAYSLAILLREYVEKHNLVVDVKIFATDLDKDAIQKAGKGIFTESIVADVTEERLAKYFVKKDDLYYISPVIRKMIIFSEHNAIQDPPLTKMDLITCRNLLIYFQPTLQKKLIASLHYSLNENKFLFLGPSESIGQEKALTLKSRKWKVYQNSTPVKSLALDYLDRKLTTSNPSYASRGNRSRHNVDEKLAEILSETLMDEFKAASAYVDKNFELISADGEVRRFFEFPKNRIRSFNILKILPQSISIALSTALRKAEKHNQKVVYKGIQYRRDGDTEMQQLTVIVRPIERLNDRNSIRDLYLILFLDEDIKQLDYDANDKNTILETQTDALKFDKDRILSLEQELLDTKANLQAMIEEVETSNEELQATNEELLASNEELQSTNEELQSVNEELYTVNSEHQEKIDEIVFLNEDLENLINSTRLGTIFLDKDLNIRRFTPVIKEFFNVIESDIGRPIHHFNTLLGEENRDELEKDIREVIKNEKTIEKEVVIENKYFLKRTSPYRDALNKTEGCVISFIDITGQKELENQLKSNLKFLENINRIIPVALYIFNQHTLSNEYANGVLERIIGYTPKEIQKMGRNFLIKLFHPEDLPRLQPYLDQINNSEIGVIHEFEYRLKHKNGSYVWLLARDTIYDRVPNTDKVRHIGIAMDITEFKISEENLKEANIIYNTVVDASLAGYWDWNIKENTFFMSSNFAEMFGYDKDEVDNSYGWVRSVMHPDEIETSDKKFQIYIDSKGDIPFKNELRYIHKNGSIVWVKCVGSVIEWGENGEPLRFVGCHIDITSLKRSEEQLKNSNQKLEVKVKERTHELENALEKFHNLYNNAPDMFLSVCAKTANIIECNNTILFKLGYKKEDLLNNKIFNFIMAESLDKAKETFKNFKKYGFVKEAGLSFKCKDGNPLDVILNASAMKDQNGEVLYSYSSLRDVTQLNMVVKDLEELTYLTSHDLKAPIANISSYVSLLKEDDTITNSISKEAINWINQNVDNAERTLKNLVSVTKARTLVLENITTINLEESIREILVVLSSTIEKSGAKITYDFNKCKTINFSKAHLISMLQNVIENAIKYKHTDRTPELDIQSFIDNDSFYCISITDNGIGIDLDEHKDQVFGLFRRANADVQGSGLALYLIRKVLEKTGGKIEVDSKLGEGSTFKLYFKK